MIASKLLPKVCFFFQLRYFFDLGLDPKINGTCFPSAMSVIRMIKMFGWERRMSALIDEKREIELTWVWWNKMYSVVNTNLQFRTFFCSHLELWLIMCLLVQKLLHSGCDYVLHILRLCEYMLFVKYVCCSNREL